MKWLSALIIAYSFAIQSWPGLPVITVSGLDIIDSYFSNGTLYR